VENLWKELSRMINMHGGFEIWNDQSEGRIGDLKSRMIDRGVELFSRMNQNIISEAHVIGIHTCSL
jgi:hypothetical protein